MTNFGIVDLHANGIHLEIDGVTVGQIEIPSDYVPYTFSPILGIHQLVTGDRLVNGMIVVIEGKNFRRNPDVLSPEYPSRAHGFVPSSYDRAQVEEQSRWALVTDLERNGSLISFNAIYSDGTMRSRTYNKSIKWAVLREFKILPVCPRCGEVHTEEEPDLETMTRRVTSELFGEEMSFSEFSDHLDDPEFLGMIADKVFGKFFSSVFDIPEDEQPNSDNAIHIPTDRPQRPDESDEEYADRLRDEDEIAGEYDASERAKIRQSQIDNEALAALRAKLSRPSDIALQSNEQ